MAKISVTIVDSHRVFCECLGSALDARQRFEVIDLATSAEEALSRLELRQPNVVLLDCGLPNEIAGSLTAQITSKFLQVRVLVLGMDDVTGPIFRCLEAGAIGYVSRQASLDDLEAAIDQAACGESVCPPNMALMLFSRLADLSRQNAYSEEPYSSLTPQELRILHLIAAGHTNKQIGQLLSISTSTVKNHVHNILSKLNIDNRVDAVRSLFGRRWLVLQGGRTLETRQHPSSSK